MNTLKYLKIREINGVDYCSANTFVKIESDFYKYEIFPLNLTLLILMGFFLPLGLLIAMLYGKKN